MFPCEVHGEQELNEPQGHSQSSEPRSYDPTLVPGRGKCLMISERVSFELTVCRYGVCPLSSIRTRSAADTQTGLQEIRETALIANTCPG